MSSGTSHAYSQNHKWVAATHIALPQVQVSEAHRRGTVRVAAGTKVEVLEVYCRQCRRPFEDVHDQPCSAAANRDHLIGGPTGERKKRKHTDHDCSALRCELPATGTG